METQRFRVLQSAIKKAFKFQGYGMLVGYIILIVLFVLILIKGFKSKHLISHLISLMIIAFLIHWFFTNSVIEVTPYFLMVCGAMLGINEIDKDEELIIVKE